MASACMRALQQQQLVESDSDDELLLSTAADLSEENDRSAMALSPSSRTHRGNNGHRSRLRTRSDVQEVIRFMEGEEEDMGSPSAKTETEAPAANTTCWDNLDPRLLPVVLTVSLLCSAICWFFLQCPLLSENGMGPLHVLRAGAAMPFVLAFGLMAFASQVDPGMVPEGYPDLAIERSYKSSQFPRRIRRYDHFCRWLLNGIGLYNHREFFLLLMVFTVMVTGSLIVDVYLLAAFFRPEHWVVECLLAAHLTYVAVFAYGLLPIVRLHVAFVSRNELANEWKDDLNYVVDDLEAGTSKWVGELDIEEFNDKFDTFRYDPTRNRWDKGWHMNCYLFWCVRRWDKHQMGEF
ncbi:unnamed protein product [Symbiodinium natans]|uniref:Palmitoyltransferase n=1 Tax=Symbiodinium natans TaxID=878477 RepID=A0A812REE8_9DINO|nr:unnamed protein product [Symbiodinium natans]